MGKKKCIVTLSDGSLRMVEVGTNVMPQNYVATVSDNLVQEDVKHMKLYGKNLVIDHEAIAKGHAETTVAQDWNNDSIANRIKKSFKGGR
jgi:hypothetical protein